METMDQNFDNKHSLQQHNVIFEDLRTTLRQK